MNNTSLLAFDCACAGASITVVAHKKAISRVLGQGKQAASLIPVIDGLMREAGIGYYDLDAIITTIGPGSFTGLRIGLAALHGFVLVHRTPIKTLTSLEAMAWSVVKSPAPPKEFITVLTVGKGEVAAQKFHVMNDRPVADGEIYLAPETKTDWALPHFGNHVSLDSANYLPGANTALLCEIADLLPTSDLVHALPLYIRPPDAVIPAAPSWLAS